MNCALFCLPCFHDFAFHTLSLTFLLELFCSECPTKGFRGSHTISAENGVPAPGHLDGANLAATYSALLILAILEDDFSRVDRKSILQTIRASQKENGSFFSQGPGSESDMRYVFCAAAICHILGDDEAIDWTRTGAFIHSAMSFDGGIGQGPHDESHGGSTYCAVASLALANRLWDYSVFSEKEIQKLIKWALWKQGEGFHGRAHKDDDSCYAFWIGATLQILNAYEFIDHERLRSFLYRAQHEMLGGFKKILAEHQVSDLLHTFFSIAALSLLREPQLNPLNSPLNVSRRAYEHIGRCRRHFL